MCILAIETALYRFSRFRKDEELPLFIHRDSKMWLLEKTARITGIVNFVHPSAGILNTTKHEVSKNWSVSVFGWGDGDTYFVGSLVKS
jgi:hypothetical protein